jgi:hypothetical protein
MMSYVSFGVQNTTVLKQSSYVFWVDNGTSFSFPNLLAGSGESERWSARQSGAPMVGPQNLAVNYYHQYADTFRYSAFGGGNPVAVTLQAEAYGNPYSVNLTTTPTKLWLDYGKAWSLSRIVPGSTLADRWVTNSFITGVVVESFVNSPTYFHQYLLTVNSLPADGGSVSVKTRWVNGSEIIPISANPNSNWAVGGWNGTGLNSYTGPEPSFSVRMQGPVTETVTFFPRIEIHSLSGGSIDFAIGSYTNKLGAGQVLVTYRPVGTAITLRANPSSLLYTFAAWSGSYSGYANPTTVQIAGPMQVYAVFGSNDLIKAVIVGPLVVIIAALAILLWRRGALSSVFPRRSTKPPTAFLATE